MRTCPPIPRRARAGFTLIELMAVIVILAILITFLVARLSGSGELVEVRLCRARLGLVEAAIREYESERGSFPSSSFRPEQGPPPNATNLGAEALFLALWSPDWGGTTLPEDDLVNSDGDRSSKALSSLPVADLFEIADPWGNPIAYLAKGDYERSDLYLTLDAQSGEPLESTVRASKSAKTGRFHNPHSFQLISAGPDGEFGTEDDVTSFPRD
jgi:prepilin-type N-terminal cleavage/methylation domain-containing protein